MNGKQEPLGIGMSVEEALATVDELAKGWTVYPGMQGWRAACLVLAEEVRRLRGESQP